MTTPEHQATRDTSAPPAEESVSSSQKQYELQIALVNAILDASPDGILVVDAKARVISVNRRFFKIWKLDLVGNEGTRGITLANTDDNPILAQVVERVFKREPGVVKVYANPATEKVYLEYDVALTNPDRLRNILQEAGFGPKTVQVSCRHCR